MKPNQARPSRPPNPEIHTLFLEPSLGQSLRKPVRAYTLTAATTCALSCGCLVLSAASTASAQRAYSTAAVSPTRYTAVHGRTSLLSGNAAKGLEAWAYPLQILDGYRPAFRISGAPDPVPASAYLRGIVYTPSYIERTYVAADFTVHERLFVPRDLPGAVVRYTVEATHPLQIVVHFQPVLNLMWPAAIGGQEVRWESAHQAYVLNEPTKRFYALVGSPDVIAHDNIENTNAPLTTDHELGLVLRSGQTSRVVIASDPAGFTETAALYERLCSSEQALVTASESSYAKLQAQSLRVHTPDPLVDQAIASSVNALDQTWVCNPQLGCGLVAGYGPSRGLARRPQYDWFFAGDALLAVRGLLAAGDFDRARDTLLFLIRYQDARSGMMWHELSQSAGYLNWVHDYPYMFPHVDITFDYVATVLTYVRATGDQSFVQAHWTSIESAYKYCASLIDEGDGLPHVPAGKEGGDEQAQPAEELSLATAWVQAADAFAELARMGGHSEMASPAKEQSMRAARSIASRFWNASNGFWIAGITRSGTPQAAMRSRPMQALSLPIFSEAQKAAVLDRLSGSEFQTDWGTRSVGTASPDFDPASYASGSVWATSTASTAEALWQQHRPMAAWQVWRSLLPWTTLDASGHLHETLSGSSFKPQRESVPEQTWSSALFLSSFVDGMLGLRPVSANDWKLAPTLPATWDHLTVENARLGHTALSFQLKRSPESLDFDLNVSGAPIRIQLSPSVPLGATLIRATLDGRPIETTIDTQGEDTRLGFSLPQAAGQHRLHFEFRDGIETSMPAEELVPGQSSQSLRLVRAALEGDTYTLMCAPPASGSEGLPNIIYLRTDRTIKSVTYGKVLDHVQNVYRIAIIPPPSDTSSSPGRTITLGVTFARSQSQKSRNFRN